MDESAAHEQLGVDFSRDAITAEMKAGDVLLFNNHIPHRFGLGGVAGSVCVCGGGGHMVMDGFCVCKALCLFVNVGGRGGALQAWRRVMCCCSTTTYYTGARTYTQYHTPVTDTTWYECRADMPSHPRPRMFVL
jgi:hypothetical protein